MSSPMGMYGGYTYQSAEVRALGSITPQSYDYRDQGKTIAKLVGDVSYMAGMQRKMQKGIDDANQNFIQQIQSFINDIIVIFGGGGDTGFDFGDLKYIFEALGALFGLEPGGVLPINLIEAAWHFFSTYIFPISNFTDIIDSIVDGLIATVLDVFGEIPIVGEALQQLAAIISAIRDLLNGVVDVIIAILDWFFGGGIWTSIGDFFTVITEFVLNLFSPVPAGNLSGTPNQGFFDLVPASVISWTDSGNLLANPVFAADTKIDGGDDWEIDELTTHSLEQSSASVKVTADGYDHELYSNAINVVEKHALTLSVWTKWTALIGSGATVHLKVAEFVNADDPSPINVVAVDHFNASGTLGWQNLDGTYHTPAGISQIRMVLAISSTASSGTVWFSDAMWKKDLVAGFMPKEWTDGLDDLNDSVEGWWGDFWDGVFGGNGSQDKTSTDAAIAAAAQAQTISGTTSQMMQILAALGRGNPDADDFERWDLFGIGTKWAAVSSAAGGLTISDGHNAQWISSFNAEYISISDVKAKTHVQSATIVLGSAPEQKTSQSLVGDNRIWLRATNFSTYATRKGLCAIFKADQTFELWWFNGAGTGTRIFAPVALPNLPVTGSVLEFNAGTNDNLMHMTARFNGAIVLDDVDSTNISSYGDTQLCRGFGGYNNAGFLLNAASGKVKQFTAVG